MVGFKTVHLNQHLVEGLLALIIATTQTGTALAADGIDFVDEDDAGAFFLAFSNMSRTRAAPTPTNISTKSEPEMLKNGTLASPAMDFANSGLARTRWANQQQTTGNTAAQLVELARVFEEVHHFLALLLWPRRNRPRRQR